MPFCRSLFRCLALRTWLFLIILFHSIQVGNITHDYVRRTTTQVSLTTPRARGVLKNVGAMVCAPFEKLGFREPWIPSKILKEVPKTEKLIKSCKLHDPKGYGMTDCDPTKFTVSRFLTQHSVCYVFDNNDKKTFGTFSSHHVFYGGGPPILWSLRLDKSWNTIFNKADMKTIRFDVYLFASGSKFPSVSGPSTTHDMTLKTRTNRATNKTEVKTVEKASFAITYQPTVFTRLESPKETACKNYSAEGKFESQEECLHHCIRDGIRSKKELKHDNLTPLLFRLNDTSNNDRIYGNSYYRTRA
ncbi:hypothetical protein HDE_05213 [Halotydeus destructor]|nr:hypothetical protein HDE_05213 [Halotydeus destructor]